MSVPRYHLVQQHLETCLVLACEGDWDGRAVPGYLEHVLRRQLECGILAYGFARARCLACGHDFLVAFSCMARGVCPSCNARRMAETAAHLVGHVLPPLPVLQCVLQVPKRLRQYPGARAKRGHYRSTCHPAGGRGPSGETLSRGLLAGALRGVGFVHRFGSSHNRHLHHHCCIVDGVFEPLEEAGVQFRQASALMPEVVTAIEEQVSRHMLLDPDDARDMFAWAQPGAAPAPLACPPSLGANGGFSLDASACIAGHDRAGLARLPGYCRRLSFALEWIKQLPAHDREQQVVYRLPKPRRDGRTEISLTPLEFIDHLAALIPPLRLAASARDRSATRVQAIVRPTSSSDSKKFPVPKYLFYSEAGRES